MGDDYEEAIKDAMKHYRSSKYRFADEVVEYELRKATVDDCTDTVLDEVCEAAEADCEACEKCECDPCECEKVEEAIEEGSYMDNPPKEIDYGPKGKGLNLYPQTEWWKNDPDDFMSYLYWRKNQLPPSKETGAFQRNWQNIVNQLSASNPPPADWVNPIEVPEPREQVCPQCKGRRSFPSNDEPCSRCDATGKVVEGELEEGGDRHAEHDWVKTIKKDAGISSEPGYHDTDADALSLENPDEQQDDADDFFSYRSKQKRTEMKEGYVKELRKLLEAETDQAESLIAAKSFSQELQDMVEKLGRLVNENLPAVSEQMRDAYGSDVATGFEDQVSGTLNTVMDSLRTSKQEIDNSVSTIADGGAPQASNDMENFSDEELGGEFDAEADLELDGDVALDLDDAELGDEFGGDDAMAGLEDEPLGRAKKESIAILGKKLIETKAKLERIKARK
jgi:hypothetical protein